jgi:hypothetical protein
VYQEVDGVVGLQLLQKGLPLLGLRTPAVPQARQRTFVVNRCCSCGACSARSTAVTRAASRVKLQIRQEGSSSMKGVVLHCDTAPSSV